ncbi:MAG: Na(+)-translocating NADH-quinone reductase subunit A [Bacteroidales bacterium]|nr:Na(+)-translocating NADH-quinone reductase subunit A [Bacteroidales bacterium]MCF8404062.1 Na(+)-translocating NADH-quinone reductase subunit A [Bacteroidales bacterium]
MSEVIKIRKGLDIHLQGEAEKKVKEVISDNFAIKPTDFHGVFPKMFVKEGDKVKAGTPVFFNKYHENIIFTSPVSGKVTEIHRGAKRKMLEVRIESDGKMDYEDFGTEAPKSLSREKIVHKLLKSGVWPLIRQRPYSVIANPEDEPKAIHISAFSSAPLAPDYNFMVDGQEKNFQAGIDALGSLTKGKVHLNLPEGGSASKVFTGVQGVNFNYFSGPHPAGNVGIQIHHIDPVNKGDVVWYLDPQAVITIGKLFLEGKYDASKIIALAGSEVKNPQYYKVIAGCNIYPVIKENRISENLRYVSGNVLSGTKIEKDGYLCYYDNQLTLIPEGNYHEFLGWAMPRFNKFSYSKTFFSWLTPGKKYRLDTNINGGHRAFVLTGEYEKVFPMNIYPMQLLKAIIVKDIDRMEQLGIYEVDEEDFALCEFIDASKTEMQAIVREGLDFIRKEME